MLVFTVVISVILAILLLSLWLSPVYAQTNTDGLKIKDIKQIKAGVSQYHVTIQYCKVDTKPQPVGVVVNSVIGKNIVAIDQNTKSGTCSPYVAKINAEKISNITVKPFYDNEVDDLAKQFEKRLQDLEEKRVKSYQQLRAEKSSLDADPKKIENIGKNIKKLDQSITNSKESIRILRTL